VQLQLISNQSFENYTHWQQLEEDYIMQILLSFYFDRWVNLLLHHILLYSQGIKKGTEQWFTKAIFNTSVKSTMFTYEGITSLLVLSFTEQTRFNRPSVWEWFINGAGTGHSVFK